MRIDFEFSCLNHSNSQGVDKSQHAVDQVTMMVKAMQEAFRENLDYIPWMSSGSAEAAKAKLEHMADLIGYPTFVLNDTWLNQGNVLLFVFTIVVVGLSLAQQMVSNLLL